MGNKKILSLVLIVFSCVGFSCSFSCSSKNKKNEPTPEEQKEVAIEQIIVNTDNLSLKIGETAQLSVSILPENATNKSIYYAPLDSSIVSVSNSGLVTALSEGSSSIIVMSSGGNKTATVNVSVTASTPEIVHVSSISLDVHELSLKVSETKQFTTSILPENSSNKMYSYSLLNNEVGTISNSGLFAATKSGSTVLTVTSADGGKKDTCSINVTSNEDIHEEVHVTSVFLDKQELNLVEGETVQLNATVLPENADNKNVSFSSSDSLIAYVSTSGLVTAAGVGTTTITVKSEDGKKTATCVVNVSAKPISVQSVLLNEQELNLKEEEIYQLIPTIFPENADNKNVAFTSSNPSVATVSSNGLVTAIEKGIAIITVNSEDGNKTDSCIVNVTKKPIYVSSVSLDKTSMSLFTSETNQLNATVLPENADNKNVSYETSNSLVATVSSSGLVTAVGEGTATITVISEDGNKTDTCVVNVTKKPIYVSSVSLNKDALTLEIEQTEQLNATVLPVDADNKNVSYETSNSLVATVSSSGLVTAVGEGTTTITVISEDGNKTDTCVITVVHKLINVSSVSFNVESLSLTVDDTEQLIVTVLPENATNKNYSFSSSSSSVASISVDGLVTALSEGQTVITVTTEDGSKTSTCTINVSAKEQSIYEEDISEPDSYGTLSDVSINKNWEDSCYIFSKSTNGDYEFSYSGLVANSWKNMKMTYSEDVTDKKYVQFKFTNYGADDVYMRIVTSDANGGKIAPNKYWLTSTKASAKVSSNTLFVTLGALSISKVTIELSSAGLSYLNFFVDSCFGDNHTETKTGHIALNGFKAGGSFTEETPEINPQDGDMDLTKNYALPENLPLFFDTQFDKESYEDSTYGKGTKLISKGTIASDSRIFMFNFGSTYNFSEHQDKTLTFYACVNGCSNVSNYQKLFAFQFLNGNSDSANRTTNEGYATSHYKEVDSENHWIRISIPFSFFTPNATDSFDRLSVKLKSYVTINKDDSLIISKAILTSSKTPAEKSFEAMPENSYPAISQYEELPNPENSITPISPINSEVVSIVHDPVKNYLKDFKDSRKDVKNAYVFDYDECDPNKKDSHNGRISDYYSTKTEYKSKPVTLTFDAGFYSSDSYIVKVSTNSDMSYAKEYLTYSDSVDLVNLYRNTRYFWTVSDKNGEHTSRVATFITDNYARFITAGNVQNVRDFGGYMTKSGKIIKQGMIYRGQELNDEDYIDSSSGNHYKNLDENTINILKNDLGIKVEYDLRSASELKDTQNTQSNLGSDVTYITNGWVGAYTYISGKAKTNIKTIKPVFEAIANAVENNEPIYIHCWGGFDRTGTVCFMLGGLLGMSFTDLCAEFEMSSFSKSLRQRDQVESDKNFPGFIKAFYDNEMGWDEENNLDIQTICWNALLSAGITSTQLNTIVNGMLA